MVGEAAEAPVSAVPGAGLTASAGGVTTDTTDTTIVITIATTEITTTATMGTTTMITTVAEGMAGVTTTAAAWRNASPTV